MAPKISLKALVHKECGKVIFIECESDFVDVLFSFLTMPIGTIIRLGRENSLTVRTGCMKRLYTSVEDIGEKEFRSSDCKGMLLRPRNAAEPYCDKLNLRLENEPKSYYLC